MRDLMFVNWDPLYGMCIVQRLLAGREGGGV